MKRKTNPRKKIFLLTMFLIFISGINEVYSQTAFTDAGVQIHETTTGMECRFVIVVEDTLNVQQVEVKLGSSAGEYSPVNTDVDYVVTDKNLTPNPSTQERGVFPNNGYFTQDIFLPNLSAGVYIVRLRTEKDVLAKKFVKE